MSESSEWGSIGRTADGGEVFVAPIGTPMCEWERQRALDAWMNPFLPLGPDDISIPEPPRRSILRDVISTMALLTRSVFR